MRKPVFKLLTDLTQVLIPYEPWENQQPGIPTRTGVTQTRLFSHRRWIEAGNAGFSKENKDADQLCSSCTADLHLCFPIYRLLVF